ncbi:MAG: hypothetical protein NTX47_04920 [Candidatus Omnitrophica bacterium]|nr:hypothetical protein [Candidatus Omnitrophota bacterium]
MTDSTPEEKLLNLIRKDQSKARIGKDLKIFTNVNIVLIGLIGVVAIVFLADAFIFKKKPPEELAADLEARIPKTQPAIIEKIEEDNAIDQSKPDKDMNIKKVSKEEIMGNFNLLGIIRGDNDQAIIEDKVLNKTFFLYKGDSLGELKVYDIKDSAVILEYKGEKVELKI